MMCLTAIFLNSMCFLDSFHWWNHCTLCQFWWLFGHEMDEEDTREIDATGWIHEDDNHPQQEWKTNKPHPINCITCNGKKCKKMILFKNDSFTKVPKQKIWNDKLRQGSGNDCHCQFPKRVAMLNSHHFKFKTQNEDIVDTFKCWLKVKNCRWKHQFLRILVLLLLNFHCCSHCEISSKHPHNMSPTTIFTVVASVTRQNFLCTGCLKIWSAVDKSTPQNFWCECSWGNFMCS